FSVPTGALAAGSKRLGDLGVAVTDLARRFDEPGVRFADRSGLTFEVVATDRDARTPWVANRFDAGMSIRGLHSVTLVVRSAAKTIDLMTKVLGYTVVDRMNTRTRVGVNGGGPGKTIDVAEHPDAAPAINDLGSVHHVAMAIGTAEEQLAIREELIRYGCKMTEGRDRCYFTSIYFREPGGVLFEIATMAPGFAIDESLPDLGRALKLPPWEEPYRADIESALAPVTY